MKKHRYREKKNSKNARCLISGKLLNGREAVSLKNIDVYMEKQVVTREKLITARIIAREEREKRK